MVVGHHGHRHPCGHRHRGHRHRGHRHRGHRHRGHQDLVPYGIHYHHGRLQGHSFYVPLIQPCIIPLQVSEQLQRFRHLHHKGLVATLQIRLQPHQLHHQRHHYIQSLQLLSFLEPFP